MQYPTTLSETWSRRATDDTLIRFRSITSSSFRERKLDTLNTQTATTEEKIRFIIDHPDDMIWSVINIKGSDRPLDSYLVAGALDAYDVLRAVARLYDIAINPNSVAESIKGTVIDYAAINLMAAHDRKAQF